MTKNRALQRSIHFLTRPYTILALILFFVNDHILRHIVPSWLTGKLGDFAWLFVAPVVAAFFLALFTPTRWKNQQQWVAILAFGLTGLFFVCLKTIPAFRDLILGNWLAILGFPAAVLIDPTDLITLLSLPASWLLWRRMDPQPQRSPLHAAWVLPVFALLTLADAAAPNYGVQNLRIYEDQIIANASYQYYASTDGGLNWQENAYIDEYYPLFNEGTNRASVSIPDTDIAYRITQSGLLESSNDNEETWQILNPNQTISDREEYYYLKTHPNAVLNPTAPRDVIYDPSTGNVIFTRGLIGVLIVTPDGKQISVGVGENQPVDLSQPSAFFTLLLPHFLLALGLMIIYGYIFLFSRKGVVHWFVILFSLALWVISLLFVFEQGYGVPFFWICFIVLALILLGMSIYMIVTSQMNKISNWGQPILFGLIGALLFLIPYLLWYAQILPKYQWAMYSSFVLVTFWIGYGIQKSRGLRPVVQAESVEIKTDPPA